MISRNKVIQVVTEQTSANRFEIKINCLFLAIAEDSLILLDVGSITNTLGIVLLGNLL